jgi:hypothetical protein
MDKQMQITEDVFAEVTEWRGKKRVDIRKWYKTATGELARTQKGLNFSLEDWQIFCDKFEELKKHVSENLK